MDRAPCAMAATTCGGSTPPALRALRTAAASAAMLAASAASDSVVRSIWLTSPKPGRHAGLRIQQSFARSRIPSGMESWTEWPSPRLEELIDPLRLSDRWWLYLDSGGRGPRDRAMEAVFTSSR